MVEKNTKKGRVRVIESVDSDGVSSNNGRVSYLVDPQLKKDHDIKARMESIFDYIKKNGYDCDSEDGLQNSKAFDILRENPPIIKSGNWPFGFMKWEEKQWSDYLGKLYVRSIDGELPEKADADNLSYVRGKLKKVNLNKYWFLEVLGSKNKSELTQLAVGLSKEYKVNIDVFKSTDESYDFEPYGYVYN